MGAEVDEHRLMLSASPPRVMGPNRGLHALLHGANVPMPAPWPPMQRFGAASKSWSRISSPPKGEGASKLHGGCRSFQGRRTGDPCPVQALIPFSGCSTVLVALLCPTPSSRQAHLDGLKGEDTVLPGVEDLQDGS